MERVSKTLSRHAPGLCVITTLGTILFLSLFTHFRFFGLYSDDAAFFGGMINRVSFAEEWNYLMWSLQGWPQGRPLGFGLNNSLFPRLAWLSGGLPGVFLLAFLVKAANAALLYRLVSRFAPRFVGFSTAAFYVLWPASTAQLSLIYAYNTEISVLVSLIALHLALSRKWIGYSICVAVAMTMAEPTAVFILGFGFLLSFESGKASFKKPIMIAVLWIVVIALIMYLRKRMGDVTGSERVGEIMGNPMDTMRHGLASAINGPITNFTLAGKRILLPLKELDGETLLILPSTFLLALVGMYLGRILPTTGQNENQQPAHQPLTVPLVSCSKDWLRACYLLVSALLVMFAIYSTYFRPPWTPATWHSGFMSGVHHIASLSSALAAAALVWFALSVSIGRLRYVVVGLVCCAIGLLASFGRMIQQDYVKAWKFQTDFWQAYAQLCPDAGQGTYVFILHRNFPSLRFIECTNWTSEVLPDGIFGYVEIPPEKFSTLQSLHPGKPGLPRPGQKITRPPSVIVSAPSLADTILCNEGAHTWKASYYFMLPKSKEEQPENGNVIALTIEDGTWKRLTGQVKLDNGFLDLKEPGTNLLELAPRRPMAAVYKLQRSK